MAITYVAGATGRGSAGIATITFPAGIQRGDVMVMAVTWKRGIGTYFFVPAGWTLWERAEGSTVTYQNMVLTKEADGNESGTDLIVNDGATQQGITVAVSIYRGAHVVPRTRNFTVANAGGTDTTVECVDPGGNQTGDRRICIASARGSLNGPSGSPNFTAITAGFTIRQQITDISGSAQNSATAIADGTGTGTVTFTANASTYSVGITLWLREGTPDTHSVFTSQTPVSANSNDGTAYTLSTTFHPTVDGYITAARWHFPTTLPTGAAGGSVKAALWEATGTGTGTLIATTEFTNPTAGAWNTAAFSTPIKVTAGTPYVIGIYTPDRYVGTTSGLAAAVSNGYLVAPAGATDPYGFGTMYNGRYFLGGTGPTFPNAQFSSSNYFADVVFTPGAHPAPNRLYLTSAAPEYTPATIRGSWTNATTTAVWKLGKRPEGEATSSARADTVATNPNNVLLGRWVSHGALKAGTISGAMNWCVGVLESNAAMNAYFRWHVYVLAGDTDTVRGVLRSEIVNTTEWISTSPVGRTGNNWTLTSTAIQAGDRLVVELGYQAQNSVTTSYTGTIYFGTQGAIDLRLADSNVSSLPAWVEFTGGDGLWWDSTGDISDNFDDGVLDTTDRWADTWNSSGTLPIETGGRLRIYCNTNYAGVLTRPWLYFRDTSVSWEITTLANGATATAECYFKGSVDSDSVPGVYLGWYLNVKTGELRANQAVAYWDSAATVLTFNSTNHRWLRIREANGTVYFETSANGTTWTTQRSVPTPYWCSYKDVAVSFDAHRDAGAEDYFEVDNFNTGPPSNQSLFRNIADAVVFADAASASVARSRAVADAVTLLDAASRVRLLPRAVADTVTAADAAGRVATSARVPADAVTVLDTAGRVILTGRVPTDAVTATDAASSTAARSRAAADAVVLADANTRALTRTRTPAETVGLTDAAGRTLLRTRTPGDTLGLADAAGRSVLRTRQLADALGLADTSAAGQALLRGVADAIAFADAASRVYVVARTAADAVATADAVARAATAWTRPVAETVTVADTATRALIRVRSVADGLAVTDMVAATRAQARSPAESVTAVDAASRAVAAVAAVAELVALTDAVASGTAVVISGSGTVALADSTARTVASGRVATDTVTAADATGRAVAAARAVADALGLADAVLAGMSIALAGAGAVTVTDTVARAATTWARTPAEAVTIADAAAGRRTFGRAVAEAVALAEAAAGGRLVAVTGAGAVALADAATRSVARTRVRAESVTVADAAAGRRSLGRAVTDSVTAVDVVFGGQLIAASGSGAVTLADAVAARRTLGRTVANAVLAYGAATRRLDSARHPVDAVLLADTSVANPTIFAYGTAAVQVADSAARALSSGARGFDVLVLLDTVVGGLVLVPVRPSQSVIVPAEPGTSVVPVDVATAQVAATPSGIVVLVPSKRIIVPVTGG